MNIEPLSAFIEITRKLIQKITLTFLGIELSFDEETKGIDERIRKIEIAKQNLQEGLIAIEQLEKEAEKNKKEVSDALLKISELEENKSGLEEELKTIKNVISTDVSTFKKVAGIPTEKEIKKERILGFVSGVFASVIASGIVMLAIWLFKKYF